MNQSNTTLCFLYLLATAATVGDWVVALFTWRRRFHPVWASVFYYALFNCVMEVPLQSLFWFSRHPAAYRAYFYLYWIYEPVSDLLCLFIGYRLLHHLWDSGVVRRFALWLFSLMAFGTTGLLLLFLSTPFAPHSTLKSIVKPLFIAECCLDLALCVMVLVLGIFRKSLGFWTEKPMRLIALGLGIMASSSLISSTLIVFFPHHFRVANFNVLGCVEAIGTTIGLAVWCFALFKTPPAEAVPTTMQRNLVLSLNNLETTGYLLQEIAKR